MDEYIREGQELVLRAGVNPKTREVNFTPDFRSFDPMVGGESSVRFFNPFPVAKPARLTPGEDWQVGVESVKIEPPRKRSKDGRRVIVVEVLVKERVERTEIIPLPFLDTCIVQTVSGERELVREEVQVDEVREMVCRVQGNGRVVFLKEMVYGGRVVGRFVMRETTAMIFIREQRAALGKCCPTLETLVTRLPRISQGKLRQYEPLSA